MQKKNWLSSAVFLGISASGAILLFTSFVSIGAMFVREGADLLSALVLLALTLAASRFTVSVTSADGVSQSKKSVAETFVFLAVMLYAIPPFGSPGPATLLAAIVAFLSTHNLGNRRQLILTSAITIFSTFISASFYGLLVGSLALQSDLEAGQQLPLNVYLLPLCVLALLQYFLSTLATAAFISIDTGQRVSLPSQESIVWTITAQLAAAASAVLFYSAINQGLDLDYVTG